MFERNNPEYGVTTMQIVEKIDTEACILEAEAKIELAMFEEIHQLQIIKDRLKHCLIIRHRNDGHIFDKPHCTIYSQNGRVADLKVQVRRTFFDTEFHQLKNHDSSSPCSLIALNTSDTDNQFWILTEKHIFFPKK